MLDVLTSSRSYQENLPAWDSQEIMNLNSKSKRSTKTCVDSTRMTEKMRATMMWLKEIPLNYAKMQLGTKVRKVMS